MKRILIWIGLSLLLIVIVLGGKLMLLERQSTIVSQGTPIKKYDTEKSALLVIDLQEYTTGKLSADTCYTEGSDNYIGLINRIIDTARVKDIPVVYVKSEISDILINLINNSLKPGSPGVSFDKRMKVISDLIVSKQREDAFSNPRLDSILISNQVNKLYVTGLDAAHCVKSTMLAAKNRGYKILAINDAIVAKSDSLKAKMVIEYKEKGIDIVNSEDILNSMN
jgi:nicotinamidase-related amidase